MKRALWLSIVLILALTGCRRQGATGLQKAAPAPGLPGAPQIETPGSTGQPSQNSRPEGTSSGGGSFGDKAAAQALDLAKNALARMIRASSPEIYSNFPKDKGQAWLSELIQKTEYKFDIEPTRYGRPLKFDYDLETPKLVATKTFLSGFPDRRLELLSPQERYQIIFQLMLDLLHEASHFYGIGITEASDANSDAWATGLLGYISEDQLICLAPYEKRESDKERDYDSASAVFINRSTGLMTSFYLNTNVSKTFDERLERWRSNYAYNDLEFLPHPQVQAKKSEEKEPYHQQPIQRLDLLVRQLGILADPTLFDRMTKEQVTSLIDDDLPLSRMGERGHPHNFRSGESALGKISEDSAELVYDRSLPEHYTLMSGIGTEVLFEGETKLYDQFRLDKTSMKARYLFGRRPENKEISEEIKASRDNPFYGKVLNLDCKRWGRIGFPLDFYKVPHALTEKDLEEVAVPKMQDPTFPTLYDFNEAWQRLAAFHENLPKDVSGSSRFEGKNGKGDRCALDIYISQRESLGSLFVSISEDPKQEKGPFRSIFIQDSTATKDGKTVSVDADRFIEELKVTSSEIHFTQAVKPDPQDLPVGFSYQVPLHKKKTILQFDPASGRIKHVKSWLLNTNDPAINCDFSAQP